MKKHKNKTTVQNKLEENAAKTQEAANKSFPDEKWVEASSIKLKQTDEEFKLPPNISGIKVARSRLTGLKGDEKILAKEIRQAKILVDIGSSIYLLPKLKTPTGYFLSGPDAIVNGSLFEFKTVTGPISKVERRFRISRKQCENVFLKIESVAISKIDVVSKIKAILKNVNYIGGTKGNLIFYLAKTKKTYFMRIKDII